MKIPVGCVGIQGLISTDMGVINKTAMERKINMNSNN